MKSHYFLLLIVPELDGNSDEIFKDCFQHSYPRTYMYIRNLNLSHRNRIFIFHFPAAAHLISKSPSPKSPLLELASKSPPG